MKTAICLLTATLTLLTTGCETSNPTARINEKAAVFASLTPAQQTDIKAGVIEQGYNADMVYMALGKPSKKVAKATTEGSVEMWTYHNFFAPPAFTVMSDAASQYRANREPGKLVNTIESTAQRSPSATRGGMQTNLHLPEPIMDTLYVQFFDGKVFSIKLESQNE